MKEGQRLRRMGVLAAAVGVLLISPQAGVLTGLPDRVELRQGGSEVLPVSAVVSASVCGTGLEAKGCEEGLRLCAGEPGEAELDFSLLGVLPLKTVKVSVKPEMRLIPGGHSVGVALNTAGVVMVGASDLGRIPSPARLAGLRSGDVIQSVDGAAVTSAEQLTACLSGGNRVQLGVLRDGAPMECDVQPAQDARDGQWRLGAWVRDSTAGVGTLTFYDPATGRFGALGHAITDVDTGVVMPAGAGEIYANHVVQVTPSQPGKPGELMGDFLSSAEAIGTLSENTDRGLFGTMEAPIENPVYPDGLPVAPAHQIHTGSAQLLTTLESGGIRAYDCEITRVFEHSGDDGRDMTLRITDQSLLKQTGGIVQGMSGSPLIQDGRIIGAVTHVMVNNPAMGYGISIESMLNGLAEREAA